MTAIATNRICVRADGTILDALRAINDGGHGIAFVTGPGDRVEGILTDGDTRRALLAGSRLDSRTLPEIMRRDFRSVGRDAGRAEVLDMMRALGISQVPVLDKKGRLAGLHTLADIAGGGTRPNWAVLMAGGQGQRLRPLTLSVPKPMISVAGRPILERLVLHLVGHGIRRIFLSVNHLAHVIVDHFGDGERFGCDITYIREDEPLGTGGALSLLPERPDHSVLVMNGDLVTQFDVEAMLDFHERGAFAATMGLRPHQTEIPFGVAEVEGDRLVGLQEKPTFRHLINAGIYVLSPEALDLAPEGEAFPITRLFEECLAQERSVGAHLITDEWTDVGRPVELQRARGDV